MKRSNYLSINGVTLIEMLIALVIFTIGVLGILGLQGVTLVGNDIAGHRNIARTLAMSELDYLKRLNPTTSIAAGQPLAPCAGAWNENSPPWCHMDTDQGAFDPAQVTYHPRQAVPATEGNIAGAALLDDQGMVAPANSNRRFRRYWHVETPGVMGFPNSRTIRVQVDWSDLGVEGFRGTGPGNTRRVRYTYVMVD